jgi:hypothetical protein
VVAFNSKNPRQGDSKRANNVMAIQRISTIVSQYCLPPQVLNDFLARNQIEEGIPPSERDI